MFLADNRPACRAAHKRHPRANKARQYPLYGAGSQDGARQLLFHMRLR